MKIEIKTAINYSQAVDASFKVSESYFFTYCFNRKQITFVKDAAAVYSKLLMITVNMTDVYI